ncbi:MAG: hypothetical protein IKC59_01885 [Clostridia bacterium]|nr:hypothetical protein [Clostridia bacterium]
MKKIALVLMALAFVLSLTGYGMGGDLKSAYEAAGYTVTDEGDYENYKIMKIQKVEGEGDDKVTHTVAMIVEFASVEDMKNIMPKKELEDAEKNCNIRETSVFFANPEEEALSAEAKTIFEKYVVFQPLAFVMNLRYIGWGMLGIFVVIGLIVITTVVLNRVTAGKKK